ncbi:MAG: hypothetical protein DWB45_05630, partial [Xanthomonadales bacterium]|nr:hypothetical protein [Xanthomonadales bacterium]
MVPPVLVEEGDRLGRAEGAGDGVTEEERLLPLLPEPLEERAQRGAPFRPALLQPCERDRLLRQDLRHGGP